MTPIAHVSDTAFWVASYRAAESARPDALFHDPLAARLADARGRASWTGAPSISGTLPRAARSSTTSTRIHEKSWC